jgi:hypothetical protein
MGGASSIIAVLTINLSLRTWPILRRSDIMPQWTLERHINSIGIQLE